MKLFFAFSFGLSATSAFCPPSIAFTGKESSLFAILDAPPMTRQTYKVPVFDEVCDTVGVTLTRFMSEIAAINPEISEIATLFGAVDTSCKAISNLVKRSQLPASETLGYQGEINVQGEDQKVS